jgi:phenylacetate-CoA ligase
VDAAHRLVQPGEASAKVLITNLYNLAQPLIRYELTDCFVPEVVPDAEGLFRARAGGRNDEILTYADGVVVHPHLIRSTLVKFPQIVDYRVRQTPSGIEVDALTEGAPDVGIVAARLRGVLLAAQLREPSVVVRAVNRIDRQSESGKLRRFIPADANRAATSGAGGG